MESSQNASPENFNSTHSVFRERMFEHRFIADLMEYCWMTKTFSVEILHSEIDDSGYDLVIINNGIPYFIQFKVTIKGAGVPSFSVHKKLLDKPNSYILLTEYEKNNITESSMYLMKVPSEEQWNSFRTATQTQNKNKPRKNLKMISKSLIKSNGRISIEQFLQKLKQ